VAAPDGRGTIVRNAHDSAGVAVSGLRGGRRTLICGGMSDCPCGSGRSYETCCEPIIAGAPAATAEALMRSRYSAYVKGGWEHLGRSLSAAQRADYSPDEARRWGEQSEWQGLTVIRTEQGGENDQIGLVEFSARFRSNGEDHEHLECALFAREDGRWVYAGQQPMRGQTVHRETPKIGRNDPCPCGSGKKYKKCCGAAA
jgi:SEC-C motif-containing protein